MKPYQDQTLIDLVIACCEDPTHPIEPLSDYIREQNYPYAIRWTYPPDFRATLEAFSKAGYRKNMPRQFLKVITQLRDIGTWGTVI